MSFPWSSNNRLRLANQFFFQVTSPNKSYLYYRRNCTALSDQQRNNTTYGKSVTNTEINDFTIARYGLVLVS